MPLLSQHTQESMRNTAKESVLILIYECLGTAMMTALITNYFSQIAISNGLGGADQSGLLLGMFVVIMFSARISGSHFNPCITFSYMIGNVKHRHFDRVLGVLYIIAQFVGAQLGSALSSIFSSGSDTAIQMNVEAGDIIQ